MITFPVVVVVILIGIPSIIAGYLVTKNFGSRSISSSFSVLIYAVGISIAFAYLLPKGQLVTGDYFIKSPAAFLIGFFDWSHGRPSCQAVRQMILPDSPAAEIDRAQLC